MKKYFLFLITLIALAFTHKNQVINVKGKVVDELGKPIIGASVLLKGTKHGTVTSSNGSFAINIPFNISKPILSFSAVGFNNQEIAINGKTEITCILKTADSSLDEVVVASGYSSAKRQRRSSATATINANTYTPNLYNQPLQGSVAGVHVTNANHPNIISFDEQYDYKNPRQSDTNSIHKAREGYDGIVENSFLQVSDNPLSTFSIDVDAASYSNIRRFINNGSLPPAGAVRIEEMINYFKYEYPQPNNNYPFSINTAQAICPWNNKHGLVLIGLQGKKIETENLPPSNLTFLIDVSGSMDYYNKLPLVIESLKLLVNNLRTEDKVSIVVYAGNAGLVLPPTTGDEKEEIIDALSKLKAGGSTAGGQGIELAYKTNLENFVKNGNNRVILCTDGDFNVGVSSDDALIRLIEEKRNLGIFLTVLGYGQGNYQDAKMQKLANKGNGNHAYIDDLNEAKKVLVNEFGGTLFTIAKDVKLQIEFNPAIIKGYRLIGYENRMLAKEDFNNDKKDAGELGSGHTVTALYEIIPNGSASTVLDSIKVDALKYQPSINNSNQTNFSELMHIKFRYKKPNEETSNLIEEAVAYNPINVTDANTNLQFAAAVAQFGLMLRNSKYKAESSYENILQLAKASLDNDADGYKKEFIKLVKKAKNLEQPKLLDDF